MLRRVETLELQVVLEHLVHQLVERGPWLPAELRCRFGRVSAQLVHVGRSHVCLIRDHVLLPVEPGDRESGLDEIAHRASLACGDDVVVGLVLLKHQPHRLDVVTRMSPVPLRIEVAQTKVLGLPRQDLRDSPRDLARHEVLSAAR